MESIIESLELGDPQGEVIVYFHGAPGAIEEAKIFEKLAVTNDLYVICFDRGAIKRTISNEAYYQEIANRIKSKIGAKQVNFIGFSIGCHVAIEVSLLLKTQVKSLDLISVAAPLEAGDFLPHMAGKQVFLLAKKLPLLFKVLSYWQKLLVKFSPKTLFSLLFTSAVERDRALMVKKEFYVWINQILSRCYGTNIKGYIRDVSNYVMPWQGKVSKCDVSTHIWHGSSDNWSPSTMAGYMAKTMPNVLSLKIIEETSHYSCLYQSIPSICERLLDSNIESRQVVNSNVKY